jgi:DNA-directed RNA polymerase subunit L
LKAEVNNYIEADDDINKRMAIKTMHEEIVDVCGSILKELNSRTFQLRDFIAWERFIQGV